MVEVEDVFRGGLLKIFSQQWRVLGAEYLVKRGMMPIYTDRVQAEKYWKENILFKEFQGNKKEMEIMDKKIKDAIANGVLIETDKKSLRWCNQYRLVPKSNGDYRLVVDMPGVNQFMKQIHFKMEGTPTLEQLLMKNDFAISYDLKETYNHVLVHPAMHSSGINQTDRETISYSDPIYSSLIIPQTAIGLSEYQSQQRRMGYICPMGIQND
jgi:hypothetical protein